MLGLKRAAIPASLHAGVDVRRWEQFGLGDRLPFFAMWYSVPPAHRSPRDCHPEVELSIVVQGTAHVEHDDGTTSTAACGDAFLLPSNEGHVIHNRSAEEPLTVFSAYWWPEAAVPAARANERLAAAQR